MRRDKLRQPAAPSRRATRGPRLMVRIDQEPFRRSATAACSAALARLEDARAAWHRFEREDKPAFARWRAREFGPLLSKAREVEAQIRDHQALVHEVEMEMRRTFQDAHRAYQRVMFRRQNPGRAPEETSPEPNDGGLGRRLSEFEQEALFQEWVKRSLGTNPDKMDDDAYSKSFETFKTHMFQARPPEPPPQNASQAGSPEGMIDEEETDDDEPAPVDARVKELYRALVRRLHPDLRADGNSAVSALWHEVQEAYAASDVARMELLLALSGLESSQLTEQTSLFQMRAVLAELQRAIRALEKSVREAQGEDAWNFARRGPDEELLTRVGRQLRLDLAARTARLDMLTSTIAGWAQGPMANPRVVVRRATRISS